MPPSTRIPPHLHPHVHLPRDDSILLLTSTLGASANWLIVRFLCDALSNNDEGREQGHNVVLVSWMREYEFWKQEARKGGGLDLERLKKQGRFAFVDGLSGLWMDGDSDAGAQAQGRRAGAGLGRSGLIEGPQSQRGGLIELSSRAAPGQILTARGPPPAARPSPAATPTAPPPATNPTPGHFTLKSLDLAHLKATITDAVSSPSTPHRKTLLILDNPDILLAVSPSLTPSVLTSLILALHALPSISHILTHIQADTPLLSLSTPPQPLELAHHNFLVKLGHMSRRILGVRVLDTGVARDVSGVVRVTEQELGWMNFGVDEKGSEAGRGKEYLYQVKGDGSVRVFERGAGGER